MKEEHSSSVTLADARFHAPWPRWKKVLAYALLSALSLAAIWFVDVKVHQAAVMPRSQASPR